LKKRFLRAVICLALFIPCLNVNYLEIRHGDDVLLASPVSFGAPFSTSYIHSVQLTPVIDEYRILGRHIWSWEERVQSHNAGLPFDAPVYGRFIMNPPWMIVRGGRMSTAGIAYRVGTEIFGQNRWSLPPFEEIAAYKMYPGLRVDIVVTVKKLLGAKVITQ
jgi:hypothetical protein